MQIGIIGLGRMGSNVAHRLHRAGHHCVVFDKRHEAVEEAAREGALGFASAEEVVMSLRHPRVVWLMLPADAVGPTLDVIAPHLEPGDTVIDAGGSHYHDDIRRSHVLRESGIHHVDVGVSGRDGAEHGYCLMIGGEEDVVVHLEPIFEALAPTPAARRTSTTEAVHEPATLGYLHCGPAGAGHFVKMVHDGIQRGLMEAYAEGFNILERANVGATLGGRTGPPPLRHPEFYRYDFDVAAIAEVWRHGSVLQSFLLDVAAGALSGPPDVPRWGDRVADLGASWALKAALDESVPAPTLASAVAKRLI
jgi:6-phosphogluconate dehydrogenase